MTGGPVVTRPAVPSFDLSRAKGLLGQLDVISSFSEVAAWDRSADQEIRNIAAHEHALESFAQTLDAFEAGCKAAHAKQPLFRWLFTSYEHKPWIREMRKSIQDQQRQLPQLADSLQAAMDKTPNSRDEQRVLLAELKQARKRLNQEKRELNQAMTGIRVSARQRSAAVGTGFDLLFSTSRSRRLNRLAIRLSKEAALAPRENAKAAIDHQINIIDRTILWVEKFHD